jgi:hypothetical protein
VSHPRDVLSELRTEQRAARSTPPPPKCIAVAPDVMDRLRSTAWPEPPAGVLNPMLGIPLVVDEDLPPGTVEPRDEFPAPHHRYQTGSSRGLTA